MLTEIRRLRLSVESEVDQYVPVGELRTTISPTKISAV
jgi:hypothetical protein